MARHLRTKNIPFRFEYSHYVNEVPGFEEDVCFRHIWVEGKNFSIYIAYTNDKPNYQIYCGYHQLDFEFYPSKENYAKLDFLFELQDDKSKLDLYLKQLENEKIEKEEENKNAENLWKEFLTKREFEEKVDMIKRWFDLTKEQRIRLQGEMFYDERLKKIYIDFLLNKV